MTDSFWVLHIEKNVCSVYELLCAHKHLQNPFISQLESNFRTYISKALFGWMSWGVKVGYFSIRESHHSLSRVIKRGIADSEFSPKGRG